jgi:hypothetical protein
MSADNGIEIIKTSAKKYRVYEYCASSRHKTRLKTFKSLEEALKYGTKQGTEYGVSYIDPEIKEKK